MIGFNKNDALKLYVDNKCEMTITLEDGIIEFQRPVDLDSEDPLDPNEVYGTFVTLRDYKVEKKNGKYILPKDYSYMLADIKYHFLWVLYYCKIYIPMDELEKFDGLVLQLFEKYNAHK